MGMRVLSLFSGIGAFETALDEENIDWELDHYCEIDKYACMSYNQIHGTTDEDNLKDVTQIDYSKIGDIDLVTYGFPCQDISAAGHQKGFFDEEGNLTRSGLFFNAADIIRHTKPKFAIFENVKNLIGKKFKAEFETVLSVLDELGYNTYWKVLNAKDYGIPQNRERVFGISIRKDIDHGCEFPKPVHLYLRLKDMLEEEVDEKYYLNREIQNRLTITDSTFTKSVIGTTAPEFRTIGQRDLVYQGNGIMGTLTASDYKQPKQILEPTDNTIVESKVKQVGNIVNTGNWDNPQRGRIYSAVNCMQGGGLEPKIIEPVICASRGRNPENPSSRKAGEPTEQRIEVNTSGCSNTLTTVQKDNYVLEPSVLKYERTEYAKKIRKQYEKGDIQERRCNMRQYGLRDDGCSNTLTTVQKDNYVLEPLLYPCMNKQGYKVAYDGDGVVTSRPHQARSMVMPSCSFAIRAQNAGDSGVCLKEGQEYRIRKLTPRECWRLMGFKDEYFDRVQGVSNSQLYKQAGNSIVVDVLRAIFRELKKQYPFEFEEDDL